MSPSASVAFEFLRIQNTSEANGMGGNGSTSLEVGPEKQLAKPRLQDLSRIKPQMMQRALSSIGLSEDRKAEFAHVNHQAKGFNGRSEAPSQAEKMDLFTVSMGFRSNTRVPDKKFTLPFAIRQTDSVSSRSVPAKAPKQQSTAQLAIFYNGMVNVYDVPAEKAGAIMRLASANRSSTIKETLHSKSASNAGNEDQPERLPVVLEIAKKLSVQRFLQKRKERINSVSPYTTMNTATLPSKAWKDSEDQIILSLACPSQ